MPFATLSWYCSGEQHYITVQAKHLYEGISHLHRKMLSNLN